MNKQEILDLDFIEVRHKLIDIGAFLDRVFRSEGDEDFRMDAFRRAMEEACKQEPNAAKRILLTFSDPTHEPIAAATTQGASGAWPGA
jgi:hypothetical protein